MARFKLHRSVTKGTEYLQGHLISLLVHDILQDLSFLIPQLDEPAIVAINFGIKIPRHAVLEQDNPGTEMVSWSTFERDVAIKVGDYMHNRKPKTKTSFELVAIVTHN